MDLEVDWIMVVFRWMHILAAITAVGATIFMRQALAPAVAALPEADRAGFHEAVRSRWALYIHLSIGFLLLSGFYNFISTMRLYKLPPSYHMLFGIKFLLALGIFFIASMLTGRSPAAARFQQQRQTWLTLNVVLAAVLVCISGVLRFIDRLPKEPAPEPAAVLIDRERIVLRSPQIAISLESMCGPAVGAALLTEAAIKKSADAHVQDESPRAAQVSA